MKSRLSFILLAVALACSIGVIVWTKWNTHTITPPPKLATEASKPMVPSYVLQRTVPMPNVALGQDWDKVRAVRDATLKAHPDLAAEYKEIIAEMNQQQKDLDAAMIEADPKVAPIVAKMKRIWQQSAPYGNATASN